MSRGSETISLEEAQKDHTVFGQRNEEELMRTAVSAMANNDYRYVCLHLRVEKLSDMSRKQLERSGVSSIFEGESFVAYGIIDNLKPFSFLSKTHPEVKTIEFEDPPNCK